MASHQDCLQLGQLLRILGCFVHFSLSQHVVELVQTLMLKLDRSARSVVHPATAAVAVAARVVATTGVPIAVVVAAGLHRR